MRYILLILALALCLLVGALQEADAMTRGRRPRGVIRRPVSIYALVPVALANQLQSAPNAPLVARTNNRAGTQALIEWRAGSLTAPQRAAISAARSDLSRDQVRAAVRAVRAQWIQE